MMPVKVDAIGDARHHISHVVVIIQENRSFENFFAGYPGANAPMVGCGRPRKSHAIGPPLQDSAPDCPAGDDKIRLHEITLEQGPNFTHLFGAAVIDWRNGNMDGFTHWSHGGDDAVYAYVKRSQLAPYWSMAHQYVLADAMFPTEFGPSWTAHLALVAGTDNLNDENNVALADFAEGHSSCRAPPGSKTTTVNADRVVKRASGPYPCLDRFNTMAQALDTAGVSWRYYVAKVHKTFIWSPFAAIKYVYDGPDWINNILEPETRVLADIAKGRLASVSWVTPSKLDSDHPGSHSDTGPSWVASIVNAIGRSPYWNSTAIVVLWDEWGGFYDNASPPQLDFRGLGIRVPCLIVSPYARRGYISHTRYEFGSILKFIEEVFPSVKPLGKTSQGYTDTRANSLGDSFDFRQPPRKFVPIRSKYPSSFFLHEPPSNDPVDTQ